MKGLPTPTADRIASRFSPSLIPWDFVDLIDRDPVAPGQLKIEQDRLAQMHPSDIADILEELAPAERQALFISLDEEIAAEALEEVKPKMQQALIESLDSEQIADIVEEMDPGAAADLLSELPDERSEAILGEMEPEERQEVEELLEFSGDSAAGRMTTDYIALPVTAALVDRPSRRCATSKATSRSSPTSTCSTKRDRIAGLIPLVQLLLAAPDAPLAELAAQPRRYLRHRRQRPQGGRTLRQIQPALAARARSRQAAGRSRPRRTGDRAACGQTTKIDSTAKRSGKLRLR